MTEIPVPIVVVRQGVPVCLDSVNEDRNQLVVTLLIWKHYNYNDEYVI